LFDARNLPVLSCFAGLAWPMRGHAISLAALFFLSTRSRAALAPHGPSACPEAGRGRNTTARHGACGTTAGHGHPIPSKRLESTVGKLHNGPFETEREARAAAHEVVRPEPGWSILHKSQNLFVLEQACERAGVELGAYDKRILDWLSGFEDSICAVVSNRRAHPHGLASSVIIDTI
jgi:hypothetical protein